MVSLIDMGGRLRMIIRDIEVIKPILEMPNLPVARVMWKPMPDLLTGVKCWIQAGGAYHTRPLHGRDCGDDGGLGGDDADRVRPHHQGYHLQRFQEGTLLQRHCLEAEGILKGRTGRDHRSRPTLIS